MDKTLEQQVADLREEVAYLKGRLDGSHPVVKYTVDEWWNKICKNYHIALPSE